MVEEKESLLGVAEPYAPAISHGLGSDTATAMVAARTKPAVVDDRNHPTAATAVRAHTEQWQQWAQQTRGAPKNAGNGRQSQQLNLRGFDNVETFW